MRTRNSLADKMEKTSAVFVRDAYKSYGKKQVLNGLCMKVSPGSIYGLLGASGCGKTTLLSCIVGRKKLNSGQLWVLGGKPGTKGSGVPGPRVGYMPQDIALVAEFTVKDAVYYFGRIIGMDEETIEERLRVLSKLLDLPPDDRILKNCSGGQQRRVSFAAAMVHKPQLLILDEPTVGLDPVLRDSIWNHLVEITEKENTAVIITTHYIEEARQAHAIGLMREGKLLAEESPQQLLTMFHTDSLEEVFLALSRKQEEGRLNGIEHRYSETNGTVQMGNSTVSLAMTELGQGSTVELTPKREDTPKEKYDHISPFSVSKHRMNALMKKNWMQFSRNYSSVLFTILFPILEMVSFFIAIGGDIKSINLAVVNDENFNQMCAPNYTINGTAIPYNFSDCEFHDLSCRFLMELDHPMIHPVYYKSLPEAIEGIKHGKVVGALYIPSNFSESLQERINEGRRVTDESLDFGSIKVWLDMSNRQIGTTIKYKLYSLYTDFQKKVFKDCRFLPEMAGIPVRFNDPVYGKDDDPYTVFVMPGMLLTMMFFMGTTMTSTIIISDRVEGVWDRSIVAGVTSLEIMITHFIMQIILIFFQMVESLILTFAIYKSEYIGSLITIALITLIQGLCGMSYGFWISIVSPTHSFANIISTGSFYPMILVCGLVWPLEGMPIGLRWFSRCLPFTVAIESLRNVIAKGWTIAHTEVWNGIVISLAWIFALGIISALMLKTKR